MAYEKKPEILKGDDSSRDFDSGDFDSCETSFEVVLETTCERLREKYVQFSIKRIREMDEELKIYEKELDEFLSQSHG